MTNRSPLRNPVIAALDIAQRTGWACSDGRSGVIDLTQYDDHATKGLVFEKWLKSELGHATLWAIERPLGFGSNIYTTNGLVFTANMTAKRQGISRSEVSASMWRKEVLGNGKAKKVDAVRWCHVNDYNPADHNEAEALCILEWALREEVAA